MNSFWAISLSHQETNINKIGQLIPVEASNENWLAERLSSIKTRLGIDELYFLQTCNRVLFLAYSPQASPITAVDLFHLFNPSLEKEQCLHLTQDCVYYKGEEVVSHLLSTASSINSLVIGEREILGQIRKAYTFAKAHQLSGDSIRILMDATVKTAKQVFTQTQIGDNAVSVVSLAVRQLIKTVKNKEANILVIGAGQTNTIAVKILKKQGYKNFSIFNRTLENAQRLAQMVNGKAYVLGDLATHTSGFDVLLSCTGAMEAIVTPTLFSKLINNNKIGENPDKKRILVDLAVPADIDVSIVEQFEVDYLNIEQLRNQGLENMELRQKEVAVALNIVEENVIAFRLKFRRRQLEKALSQIPIEVKAVKGRAYDQVFHKEIAELDDTSRATLDKVINYLEKKYIGIPVAIAKTALEKELKTD